MIGTTSPWKSDGKSDIIRRLHKVTETCCIPQPADRSGSAWPSGSPARCSSSPGWSGCSPEFAVGREKQKGSEEDRPGAEETRLNISIRQLREWMQRHHQRYCLFKFPFTIQLSQTQAKIWLINHYHLLCFCRRWFVALCFWWRFMLCLQPNTRWVRSHSHISTFALKCECCECTVRSCPNLSHFL